MWIKYIIPEDGDEHTHPNIYQYNNGSNSEVLVVDIVKSFPVPGKYHFRFLKTVGSFTVWLDSPDGNSVAPTFQGSIFVKASRIAAAEIKVNGSSSTANLISESESSPRPNNNKPLLNIHEEPIFDQPSPVSAAPAASVFGNDDLLGLSGNTSASAKTTLAPDPFGFDTLQPTNLTPTPSSSNPLNSINSSNNRLNTTSPIGGGIPSGMKNPMQPPPMGQGFAPMGGGMNPMGGGNLNAINRGPPRGVPPRGFDPFDTLNSGFTGGNAQSQYNRGGTGPKRNY